METFYLIDYENVNSDGLCGCNKLTASDSIIIFFTKNAKKIDMSEIANHGDASLKMIEIPAGRQSVDIHIGSYLGYICGKNEGKNCNVVIISKDTDFDNVIKFWKDRAKISISRVQQIKASIAEASTTNQEQPLSKCDKLTDVNNSNTAAPRGHDKTAMNNEIMQLLSKSGYSNDIANYVASTVVKNMGEKNGKQQIYRSIISKYGQTEGLAVYNQIKKHV